MQKIVAITGAGMSADSGLKTFRDNDGLWDGHDVAEVATPEAWERDPLLVLRFYNERRAALEQAKPNAGHLALADLDRDHEVHIVTQNVDDLHERAGSKRVLHLHGELTKARSVRNEALVVDIGYQRIEIGDQGIDTEQLRPNIVWFGESVPLIEEAAHIVSDADILLVIGTSLVVYPAAGLIHQARSGVTTYLVDPQKPDSIDIENVHWIQASAAEGVPELASRLRA